MSSCYGQGLAAVAGAVVTMLHPDAMSTCSMNTPHRGKTLLPCNTSGAFKKLQEIRTPGRSHYCPYHQASWRRKGEAEGAIYISNTFNGHEKAKTWWVRPSGREEMSQGLRHVHWGWWRAGDHDGQSKGGREKLIQIVSQSSRVGVSSGSRGRCGLLRAQLSPETTAENYLLWPSTSALGSLAIGCSLKKLFCLEGLSPASIFLHALCPLAGPYHLSSSSPALPHASRSAAC